MAAVTGSPSSAEVRARARRIKWAEFRARRGVRSTARLLLIATYSITMMWGGFFDWAGWTETILWGVAGVLWIVLLVGYVRDVLRANDRVRFVLHHLAVPLLLIAPAFMWLAWVPVVTFVLVVLAYILELRKHSAGDGFLFSFGLVIFVGVFAALSMVEIEDENTNSTLRSPSDALFWAFASLLRINYGKSMSPETTDGRVLATVVGVCAVLAASLFTAQVITWVIGSQKKEEEEEELSEADETDESAVDPVRAELAEIRAELAALRAELAAERSSSAGPPTEPPSRVSP